MGDKYSRSFVFLVRQLCGGCLTVAQSITEPQLKELPSFSHIPTPPQSFLRSPLKKALTLRFLSHSLHLADSIQRQVFVQCGGSSATEKRLKIYQN